MKSGRISFAIAALLVVAACDTIDQRVYFDGNYYPSKSRSLDGDRQMFIASVSRVNRGLNGARQAAAFEATRYCVLNFGNSEILWAAGPDRQLTPEDTKNGRLAVTGKCVGW